MGASCALTSCACRLQFLSVKMSLQAPNCSVRGLRLIMLPWGVPISLSLLPNSRLISFARNYSWGLGVYLIRVECMMVWCQGGAAGECGGRGGRRACVGTLCKCACARHAPPAQRLARSRPDHCAHQPSGDFMIRQSSMAHHPSPQLVCTFGTFHHSRHTLEQKRGVDSHASHLATHTHARAYPLSLCLKRTWTPICVPRLGVCMP